jgi:hypothetical protein
LREQARPRVQLRQSRGGLVYAFVQGSSHCGSADAAPPRNVRNTRPVAAAVAIS